MLSVRRYMIVGLIAATISCMQTNAMGCLCQCTCKPPARVTVTVIQQQGQQTSPSVYPGLVRQNALLEARETSADRQAAPAPQEMEEPHREQSQESQFPGQPMQLDSIPEAPENEEIPGSVPQA
ncbi:MAG: hypothetical protein ACHQVS_01880 [Candidatus Babeliales bacterium]